MEFEEFSKIFQSHVKALSHNRQIELALSVCKKLFSDYQEFYLKNNWGNPDIILDAIELCRRYNVHQISATTLKEMLPKILNITPDTEDFENASYALNSCTAVYETLEFLIDKNHAHIFNIGTYLTDTISFKIQENDDLLQTQIDHHPMMIEARYFLLHA